ncbi:hypothetical protein ORIO_20575 (plasmid) [Cereibacter azotoformans]|uniref:Uncharacterized protein n=1 Tax=Cereibacter sphaeroides (strain ATCC 17025 / ATH 2.4.3) TaxID=349102 RepID=A4X053_CERS5|nr:hypothetical protein [Cereibacter azotoformans]AXQ96094.1 hypothetical protein D0Z66_20450 [Cereibacter sphaeroides]UIJ32934.1 hypothetical protein LV780_20395 [Cereibacter azotoformans]ULB12196.1 hypothetical protein ORIO_20575 [Cereibacter azotoformans]
MVTKDHLFNAPIRSWMPIAVYKAYLPNMPDVVMGKVPALMSGAPGLRWKTWICETREERENVLKQLDKPCPVTQGALDFRRGPDSAVARKASGMALRPDAGISVAVYAPPFKGWPWLVLLWSAHPAPGLERDRYAWETFMTEKALHRHLRELSGLASERGCEVIAATSGT